MAAAAAGASSSNAPETSAASFGAPSSSWVTVSEHVPFWWSLISFVRRVKPSAALSGSIAIRQVVTSLRGGSASMTSPSTMTSGIG